jgi:hypothetical protein
MNATTNQAEQEPTTAPRLGIPYISKILSLLLEKAADNLTSDELDWLSTGATETVYCEIDNLHTVVAGIAGLVATDKNAGNFSHSDEVSGLMWSIAHQLDVIRGLESLAHNAKVRNEDKRRENDK